MPVENADAPKTGAAVKAAEAMQTFPPIGLSSPLPTIRTFHSDRHGIITNWVPFHTKLSLPSCEEMFTLPVHDMSQRASLLLNNGSFVVRMSREHTAVIVMTASGEREHYMKHMPVKELSYKSVMYA
jgi:hypothetical protein